MLDVFSTKLYFHRKLKTKKNLELKEDDYIKEEVVNNYEKCTTCENGFIFINNVPKLCEKCLGSGRILIKREVIVKSKKED